MTMDSEYPLDEKTVLLDRDGLGPARGPVTDFPSPPRFEQLEDRMIYAANLPGQRFKMGTNMLLAAAWELLSQVAQLKASPARESLQALNDQLSSAISAFEAHALHLGAETSQVMSARYVLCSVIDEAVVTTPWGSCTDWSKRSLLSRFHNETFGGEKFFQLLERLSRDPVKHIAMLELMYLCLALGFEGKYRVMERGRGQLEAVQDAVYRQIRHVRGDRVPLSISPERGKAPRGRIRIVSAMWAAVGVLACLLVMYSGFAWVLSQEREAALQPLQFPVSVLSRTPS
ncbi:type IVB secretion system protein IcmH/DotU [Pseudomonas simiae]|jgi:type VI secretion system protein ImpK|uniref:DotU family type IV/VI secretion system protein n=1 Tax=Pseudomonas simiae TaxID=321846 RepID=A0ABS9G866_9PSED|nr:type IVB secretion system protein IcmH/DotU [Pseudomonas simiae]MCF5049423.1 DotU family type IV/VI secretion system protein [Pseudomonas simiae]MCF5188343.1 DotU family type IV/VI secretion system protein [Pseudomonas simiae]MCF5287993.1 DotU family type IV/VI secretion system protein [Pseudomonas simiae]MCF5319721.1 DotU family type IV/VI secretion system protein [Pseudomonas simiae]MCF5334217.1 DotU family type IV/VI secretion system protein [Pseudomonas simiae]